MVYFTFKYQYHFTVHGAIIWLLTDYEVTLLLQPFATAKCREGTVG